LRDGLRFDSWSPGGEWVAYWIGERSEGFPAYLAFVAPGSGKLCPHEVVVAQNLWSDSITWQEDGSAIVITSLGEEPLRGTPCQQFSLAEKRTVPETTGEISPDGRYRTETIVVEWEGQLAHSLTTITDTTTNQTVVTVRWGVALILPAVEAGSTMNCT
jgi:hypothetical protein